MPNKLSGQQVRVLKLLRAGASPFQGTVTARAHCGRMKTLRSLEGRELIYYWLFRYTATAAGEAALNKVIS